MTPMLRLVARAYAHRHTPDELSQMCFVFPNKRSATFFLRYLDLEMSGPHIEPDVTTISDFVASLSPLAEAPRFMQLATLYEAYRLIAPGSATDFDRFMFWGEVILSDFADVDRYMANPRELFSNIEELREINSTYLTDTQREIIRRYWGEETPGAPYGTEGDEAERFWTHTAPGEREGGSPRASAKFVSLWQILYPLYVKFNSLLADDGYATSGQLYRHAAMTLRDKGAAALRYPAARYIFVGFNMLSTSEIAVFEALKRAGMADFYWDTASGAFDTESNPAGVMVRRGEAMFPSLYDIGDDTPGARPTIEILGVASGVAQAKVAAGYLERWHREGLIGSGPDDSSGTDTAIVLADEALLIPLLGNMPDCITTTNVTMGFPMKLTPIAAVMRSAVGLQRRVRMVEGRPAFFFEDVVALVSQPAVRAIAPDDSERLLRDISERRLFSIDAATALLEYPRLAPLFRVLGRDGEASLELSASYFRGLIDLFSLYATEEERPVERRFLMACRSALDELTDAFRHRGIAMRETTMAALIEKALATATVNFAGEPLRGVQVMGVLETRSLDFDNIIMMSMNESVYPRRHSRPSFVPEALRHAFGLPGRDLAESVYGYYFFRLLSRASRVTLLYDARTVGIEKVGEMSRYLSQLLYLFPDAGISHRSAIFTRLKGAERPPLSIAKTPEVMALLDQFKRPGSGKNLSASALNTYINCPMQFYLETVEGLRFRSETESSDFIDWSTYGQIVHEVAQRLYDMMASESGDSTITPQALRVMATDRRMISRLVTAAVNRHYLHLSHKGEPDRLDALKGEPGVLGALMTELMQRMLVLESDTLRPFIFRGAEVPVNDSIILSPDLPPLNVRQVIDRIDFAGPLDSMRFVDYKTGGDKITAPSVAAAFDSSLADRPKVFFQLLFYCHCYAASTGYDGPIQPFVYRTRTFYTEPLLPMKIGGKEVVDYREYADEFRELLAATVNRIFDATTPFDAAINNPACDGHECRFCRFKPICSPPQ